MTRWEWFVVVGLMIESVVLIVTGRGVLDGAAAFVAAAGAALLVWAKA